MQYWNYLLYQDQFYVGVDMVPKCSTSNGIQYYPGKRDHNTKKDHIKGILPYCTVWGNRFGQIGSDSYPSTSVCWVHLESIKVPSRFYPIRTAYARTDPDWQGVTGGNPCGASGLRPLLRQTNSSRQEQAALDSISTECQYLTARRYYMY